MAIKYNSAEVDLARVYFTGTDTLVTGMALCFDSNSTTGGTITTAQTDRSYSVEKPADGNLRQFAGLVDISSNGVTGPAWINIARPNRAYPTIVTARVYGTTTGSSFGGSTVLGVVGGTYSLKASTYAQPAVAFANQTGGSSSANHDIQVALIGLMAPAITVATGIGVASTTILKSPTGGTTGGTFALLNVTTGGTAVAVATIEDNFTKIAKYIDLIVASLKKANIMS